VIEDVIELPDGRTVGFADYGKPEHTAVLWCHGGPGSRLEPSTAADVAAARGFRVIGIDRPGYGRSSVRAGRSIADWVPDALAVADRLGIDRFVTVGMSTGGAYALALAALAPERVIGVVAACALTDMRWTEGKAMMTEEATGGIWSAPDRDAAIELARKAFGDDGSGMMEQAGTSELAPSDLAVFTDPAFLSGMEVSMKEMFANGVQGYVDDRLADGVGWGSFDVSTITCPVFVLHGGADSIVPVAHAHHTAAIVPGARLEVHDALGHFSIGIAVPDALTALVASTA
jgi:pimeloyl-ACP methyl ester carboxylesterase